MQARLWIIGTGLLGASAWGSVPASSAPALQCGTQGGEKLFQARFTDKSAKPAREMTLAIHRIDGKGTRSRILAQIKAGNRCEAVCVLRRFEAEDSLAAQSMDLDCRSAGLGHLVTPATVFWAKSRPSNESDRSPALRFGTWLNGYVRVPIWVQLDRYAPSSPTPGAIPRAVQVASASVRR